MAINISVVHAVFSILVPYLIVTTIFPGRDRWIGNKLYVTLLLALIAVIVFTFLVIALPPSRYHYNEGRAAAAHHCLIGGIILAAWKMPSMQFSKWNIWLNAAVLFVLGFLYTVGYMFLPDVCGGSIRLRIRLVSSSSSSRCQFLHHQIAGIPPRDTVTLRPALSSL